ncbi:MgtC/SapB family protein [Psychromicrobium xiongbiense]|uniref:MgtC/SapB family protein n=1 Tax=Psychromicrobium xiongbiense TaxID=3051184 RepID=UPI0025524FDF|nr:MgtC/SapB family protein [Psychromicrobium sp. YIM S02556]
MHQEFYYLIHIALAVVLSMLIGFEREFHQKAAGMRTHTLVGLGAALFMVISKYGFNDISTEPGYSLDGSRIAAQVVSGIGFLGAGLIFVRKDAVRGLTTAASIWLVAAVGMAAGAGLFLIAPGVTLVYFAVTLGIPYLQNSMPHSKKSMAALKVRYLDGHGVLRHIIISLADHGVKVSDLEMGRRLFDDTLEAGTHLDILLKLTGAPQSMAEAVLALQEVDGVEAAVLTEINQAA